MTQVSYHYGTFQLIRCILEVGKNHMPKAYQETEGDKLKGVGVIQKLRNDWEVGGDLIIIIMWRFTICLRKTIKSHDRGDKTIQIRAFWKKLTKTRGKNHTNVLKR